MNPELKTKWLAALRNGKYTQTTRFLRDDRGHCFLGVLADIIDPHGWEKQRDGWRWHGTLAYLPEDTVQIHGLESSTLWKLACMNDGVDTAACTFSEIANYIEANL